MNANAAPVIAIFEKKVRLEVPIFQRQYVWSKEQQWEPRWEDLTRKFSEHLDGRKDAPVHFLGAMVLDQKQTPTTHVERRQVIDGQVPPKPASYRALETERFSFVASFTRRRGGA